MYLHLGNDYIVNEKDIIGIFDIENSSVSQITKQFLNLASKNARVVNCTYEMPKSFVVCMENGEEVAYISPISVATLKKRAKTMF